MTPANTGKNKPNKIEVNITDHINKGNLLLCFKPLAPIEKIVVKKFIDPAIEATSVYINL